MPTIKVPRHDSSMVFGISNVGLNPLISQSRCEFSNKRFNHCEANDRLLEMCRKLWKRIINQKYLASLFGTALFAGLSLFNFPCYEQKSELYPLFRRKTHSLQGSGRLKYINKLPKIFDLSLVSITTYFVFWIFLWLCCRLSFCLILK
jgi:hypothetical protein